MSLGVATPSPDTAYMLNRWIFWAWIPVFLAVGSIGFIRKWPLTKGVWVLAETLALWNLSWIAVDVAQGQTPSVGRWFELALWIAGPWLIARYVERREDGTQS